jgi:hypothetical protein
MVGQTTFLAVLFAAGVVASAVAKRLWRDKPLVRDRQGIIPRLRLAIGEKSLAKFCRLSHRPSSMAFLAASVKRPGISFMFIFTIGSFNHRKGKRC